MDCKPPYLSQETWNKWKNPIILKNKKRYNIKQVKKCSICLMIIKKLTKWDKLHLGYSTVDNVFNIVNLDCKHYFHRKCIKKWLDKNNTCPNCRAKINNNCLIF